MDGHLAGNPESGPQRNLDGTPTMPPGAVNMKYGVRVGDNDSIARANAGGFVSRGNGSQPYMEGVYGGVNAKVHDHSASLGINHIPHHNMTSMQASATANLVKSGNFSLDATANAQRQMSGPFRGNTNYGGGLDMNYKW